MIKQNTVYSLFRPRLRSRHPSHEMLRPKYKNLPLLPFKSVIKLGSITDLKDTITNGGNRIEINTIKAVNNSANKLLMKQCFTENNVKTADWHSGLFDENISSIYEINNEGIEFLYDTYPESEHFATNFIKFPIISKHIHGSRGTGNKKHDNKESIEKWLKSKDLSKYIFEKYYNYVREYRLHVTSNGCFYACRKVIKNDTPQHLRWFRNDKHCNWILEDNDLFDKPVNWNDIVNESVKALNAVGLDIGATDVRVQSATNKHGEKRDNPEFIIVEINSAPSFGKITSEKYIQEIPKILNKKYND